MFLENVFWIFWNLGKEELKNKRLLLHFLSFMHYDIKRKTCDLKHKNYISKLPVQVLKVETWSYNWGACSWKNQKIRFANKDLFHLEVKQMYRKFC